MEPQAIDDLSIDFALNLLAVYPEWRAFVRQERRSGDALDHLIIEVSAPVGGSPPLLITTENHEVTIYFGDCHSHFDWPVTMEAPYIVDPLEFIAAITDEKISVLSSWDGANWCGSMWLEPNDDPNQEAHYRATRIEVRSWNGNRNYDFDLSQN